MQTREYWDSYHRGVRGCEWYCESAAALACLSAARSALGDARPLRLALHVGCGSSSLGDGLEAAGPGQPASARVQCVSTDFSPVCIAWQRERRPAGLFAVADVRGDARAALSEALGPGEAVAAAAGADLIVDKGTFDALLQRDTPEASAAAAEGLAALVRGTRCWAGGTRGDCSVLALMSIAAPAKRMPAFAAALCAQLGVVMEDAPGGVGGAAAAAAADGGLRILEARASADGRMTLHAVEVPLPPLEMPGQAVSYVYYIRVAPPPDAAI